MPRPAPALVLGCTHYSFLKRQIQIVAGEETAIVDTGDAVARRLQSVLAEQDLLSGNGEPARVVFTTSGDVGAQEVLIARCWGEEVVVGVFD